MALGHIADAVGVPWVFNLLSVLPILGFVLTLFVKEPAAIYEERPAMKG